MVVFISRAAKPLKNSWRLDILSPEHYISERMEIVDMQESRLRTLSIEFAVQILNLVKSLKDRHETIVSNQIGRAGTSIGANIHEAQYA